MPVRPRTEMKNNSNINIDLEAYKKQLEVELLKVINTPVSKLRKLVRVKRQTDKIIQQAQR